MNCVYQLPIQLLHSGHRIGTNRIFSNQQNASQRLTRADALKCSDRHRKPEGSSTSGLNTHIRMHYYSRHHQKRRLFLLYPCYILEMVTTIVHVHGIYAKCLCVCECVWPHLQTQPKVAPAFAHTQTVRPTGRHRPTSVFGSSV